MAVDTDDKKRAGLTAGMPFYPSGTSLGTPISMSDKWESAWTYPIGQYELTFTPSDSFSIADIDIFGIGLNKADLLTLADALSNVIGLNKIDSLSITDVIDTLITIVLEVSDTITVADATTFVTDFVRSYTDVLSISDIIDLVVTVITRSYLDLVSISDSIELVIPSWLRKTRVGDNVYYIKIKRIR